MPGTAVCGVGGAFEQAAGREFADDLAGHHGVDAGVVGELGLPGRVAAVVLQPPQRGEKHELNVGQLVGGQRLADLTLP